MKKTFCDRCGKVSDINPNTNVYGAPSFYIQKIGPYDMNIRDIDLCPECEKELYNWIFNKSKDDANGEK